jgi:hypothetical protein
MPLTIGHFTARDDAGTSADLTPSRFDRKRCLKHVADRVFPLVLAVPQ